MHILFYLIGVLTKAKTSYMTIWFNRKFNGVKRYCSKSISMNFRPQHFRMVKAFTNGAKKGVKEHTCFDLNIHFFGLFFSYTNWDYNQ